MKWREIPIGDFFEAIDAPIIARRRLRYLIQGNIALVFAGDKVFQSLGTMTLQEFEFFDPRTVAARFH